MASESFNKSGSNSSQVMDGNASNDSFSGISSFEVDKTVADKFEGVLFNVLPSGQKVNIQFCIPVLFKDFMGLLEKEFEKSSWTISDKFSVTSHIQGRKVNIKVFESYQARAISFGRT